MCERRRKQRCCTASAGAILAKWQERASERMRRIDPDRETGASGRDGEASKRESRWMDGEGLREVGLVSVDGFILHTTRTYHHRCHPRNVRRLVESRRGQYYIRASDSGFRRTGRSCGVGNSANLAKGSHDPRFRVPQAPGPEFFDVRADHAARHRYVVKPVCRSSANNASPGVLACSLVGSDRQATT